MLDFGCWLKPRARHEFANIQHPRSNIRLPTSNIQLATLKLRTNGELEGCPPTGRRSRLLRVDRGWANDSRVDRRQAGQFPNRRADRQSRDLLLQRRHRIERYRL